MISNSMPINIVLDRLEGVRPSGTGKWQARCPAHEDRRPSLSVTIGDDGKLLLYCHGGCSFDEICRALGIQPRELFPPKGLPHRSHGDILATYNYTNEDGEVLFQVVRQKPKTFRL